MCVYKTISVSSFGLLFWTVLVSDFRLWWELREDMEEQRYETLKELGSGNFGVARLAKDKKTGDLVAIKYIQRGKKVQCSWNLGNL